MQVALARIAQPTELIVVDNGSKDTAKYVDKRFPRAKVIRLDENAGYAGGVMAGIRHSSGEWIALVNDDVTLEPDALAELLRVGETNSEVGSVAAQMRFAGNRDTLNSAGLLVDRLGIVSDRLVGSPVSESETEPVRVFGASGGAGIFRRWMLAETEGLDESFFAFLEDGDLAWRARMRGWDSLYAPGAVAYHHHSATAGHASAFKHYLVGRNRVRLLAKNASRRHLIRYGPAIVAYDLAYVLFAAVAHRTLAPLRGRVRGLREWRTYRRRGARWRRPIELPPSPGLLGALRRNRVWTGKHGAAPRRLSFSPLAPLVAFPAVWTLGVVLAQIHVLSIQRPWSQTMWAVVFATPAAFVLGGLLVTRFVAARLSEQTVEPDEPPPDGRRLVRLALAGCLLLGLAETVHQFARIRAIPLFASDIDAVRVKQGGPSIVLTDFLTVAAIVALVLPRKLFSRTARIELAIAAMALGAFALAGGRVVVAIPVVAAFFGRALLWGLPRPRTIAAGGAVALLLLGGLFYIRAAQHSNDPTGRELFAGVIPETPAPLRPLVPFHIGMATNFEALARVVDHFPEAEPYGHWRYNAHSLDLVFRGARDLTDTTKRLSGPWITSTVVGPFWADGGIALVVIGMLLVGALTSAAYTWARRSPSLATNLVAGYLLFLALFGFYQNLYTQYVDWLFVTPLLAICGVLAEGPAGLRRLAAGRGRRYEPATPEMDKVERRREAKRSNVARRRFAAAAAVLALAIVGIVIYAVTRSDSTPLAPTLPIAIAETFAFPPGISLAGARTATDGDSPLDNDPVWVFRRGALTTVERISFGRSELSAETLGAIDLGATWRDTTLDVGRWGARGEDAVFAIRRVADGVEVRVFLPGERFRLVDRGVAPLEPVSPLTQRVYGLATWSEGLPDLFAVDLGSRRERVRVRAFSGESLFSNLILADRVPFLGGQEPGFSFDFGQVTPPRPDLIFVKRNRPTGSRRAEVHVLSGEARFRRFFVERAIDLPTNLPPSYRFAYGTSFGRGALYGLDGRRPGRPRLALLPFFPRAPG